MIYYIMFFINAILIQIGITVKNKKVSTFLMILAVLVPATLAGMRDYTVGTDVMVYGLNLYKAAESSQNIFTFFVKYISLMEPGYLFLTYICSVFFNSAHAYFWVIGVLNYGLLIKAIYDNKDNIIPGLAWLFYAFLYFGDSLNIMRQSLAIACVLVGYKYIRERRIRPYVICVIVASLFHQSAIITISFYILYGIIESKNKWFYYLGIICASICLLFTYDKVMQILINIGIFTNKFERYLGGAGVEILYTAMIFRVIPLLLILVFWKSIEKTEGVHFLLLMILMDCILYNLASVSSALYRVCAYMGYFRVFAYSLLCAKIRRVFNQKIVAGILSVFLIYIFFYEAIVN